MSRLVYVLNGPNLNLLGKRQLRAPLTRCATETAAG